MKELYTVEDNYPKDMNNSQFNSSDNDSFFEWTKKTVFLQLFQLSTNAIVHESKQLSWSSSASNFASNIQALDSVSVEWNSLKDDSLQSVTEDHEEVILGSDDNFGPVTETYYIPNYSDAITCFDVKTPSSIQAGSDYGCCDVLNCSDDLSSSGGAASSISWDVIDQSIAPNWQFSARHRNNCLFSVDLCSLVGQRYLQFQSTCAHFDLDDEISYELYCQWPMIEDPSRWLRPRPEPYPVTFKKEVSSSSFTHLYRFSRAEQMEFARKVGHWLNRKSRKLQRQMKPCFVPLARLSVVALTKYQSCQPVVCLAPLSKFVIKRWTKKKMVVNTSSKMLPKRCKRSVARVFRTNSGYPVVPLTRCDFKPSKKLRLFEPQSAMRVPLSCLNQTREMFSVKFSSLAVTSHSLGCSKFLENSSLYKKFLRKPTIVLEKVSSTFNRIKLPDSVTRMSTIRRENRRRSTLNLTAKTCMVLLRDLGGNCMKKGNPSSAAVVQKRKVMHMKIDQCFVNLTDCSGKNSVSVRSTRCAELKRRGHSNSGRMCVKENHSTLAKSLANVKSVRSNSNSLVLKQNRSNVI